MINAKIRTLVMSSMATVAMFMAFTVTIQASSTTYEPTWESLKAHQNPEWFLDAKFGIYTHWGPITVATESAPAEMEWYAQQLYLPDHPAFQYHRQRFGDQKTVGYKDVIPYFKAEKFNADEWADLFARAGARFAGPVAIHHDHFANWDSSVTRWNSMAMGPKRDLTGELAKAIRAKGMKFLTTFHHGYAWRYYQPAFNYDAADPQWSDLYGQPHKPGDPPSGKFLDTWLALVNEVLTKYQPDLIWFDFELGSVITPEYQRRMFASTYNWAALNNRTIGVAHKHPEIQQYTGILDYERGREDRIKPYPWLTDTSIGPWFHHSVSQFKTADELIHVFVDIVSKNGCMLLNVGPKADGTIPEQGKSLLVAIGKWLEVNGQAIYDTRPWLAYGEGPTHKRGGAFSEESDRSGYTPDDLRFTRSKDGKTLFIIALGRPLKEIQVQSMKVNSADQQARIELLGTGPATFRINAQKQLVIQPPAQLKGDHAFAFKLTGFDISLHDVAKFGQPDTITLAPDKAVLEGTQIKTQVNENRTNIGFWDRPTERIHWLIPISEAGNYLIRGEVSSAYGPSGLKLTVADQSLSATIPQTDGWFKPAFVFFGTLSFPKPGVYHAVLEPPDPGVWKAVNVYQVQLASEE